MTSNRAELGAGPSAGRRYVVTLDDNLSPALVQRGQRHYTSPALGADAVALASALTSAVVTTTGWWALPAAGGQRIVVLREA